MGGSLSRNVVVNVVRSNKERIVEGWTILGVRHFGKGSDGFIAFPSPVRELPDVRLLFAARLADDDPRRRELLERPPAGLAIVTFREIDKTVGLEGNPPDAA